MLNACPQYHLPSLDIEVFKTSLSLHLRSVPPSLRVEAAARGLGYQTYNGFRAAVAENTVLSMNAEAATQWLKEQGHECDPVSFHKSMCRTSAHYYMNEWPDLNANGLMVVIDGHVAHWLYGQRQSPWNDERFLQKRENSRSELLKAESEILRAVAMCSLISPIKGECSVFGSYGAKHLAENLEYRLADGIQLSTSYVCNGALIVGALTSGFRLFKGHYGDLNPSFNMSAKSIRYLQKFDQRQH